MDGPRARGVGAGEALGALGALGAGGVSGGAGVFGGALAPGALRPVGDSTRPRGRVDQLQQIRRQTQDAMLAVRAAEASLSRTHGTLQRLRLLTDQAAADGHTEHGRTILQAQVRELTLEAGRLSDCTLPAVDVTTRADADSALPGIDAARTTVQLRRAELARRRRWLDRRLKQLDVAVENVTAARNRASTRAPRPPRPPRSAGATQPSGPAQPLGRAQPTGPAQSSGRAQPPGRAQRAR